MIRNLFGKKVRQKKTAPQDGEKVVKESKYKNKKVEYQGEQFDSKKELEYYLSFKQLQEQGKIKNLERQVEYELQAGFRDKFGKFHRPIKYIADFKYTIVEIEEDVVIDVKASKIFQTDVYKIKKKLLLFKYPLLTFKELY